MVLNLRWIRIPAHCDRRKKWNIGTLRGSMNLGLQGKRGGAKNCAEFAGHVVGEVTVLGPAGY